MKGKNPTRAQRKIIEKNDLDPKDWLVVKNPSHEIAIVHRGTGEVKTYNL